MSEFFSAGNFSIAQATPDMIDLTSVKFKQTNGLADKSIDIVKSRLKIILDYMGSWSRSTKFIDTSQVHIPGSMAHEIFGTKNLVCGQVLDAIT